jgi:hypothetical protein
MSSTSLFIGYARSTCDRAQVQTVLAPLVGLMDRIDETTRKDSKGYDYKMFFIHFKTTNPQLEQVIARIAKEEFINIVYDTQWDKRKWNDDTQEYGAEVKRFWKVTLYVSQHKNADKAQSNKAPFHKVKPPATPHIMSSEEAALLCTRKPNSQHAEVSQPSRRRKHD